MRPVAGVLRLGELSGELRRGFRVEGMNTARPRHSHQEVPMGAATVMINLGFGMGLALASALLLMI